MQAQRLSIDNLSDSIYKFNNRLEYKKSQDTLFNLLESEDLSESDKLEINILLSLTYKRLQDYKSAIYYLSNAKKIAVNNQFVDSETNIDAQFAFAYFDTQDYDKANKIMKRIAAQNYKYLDNDNQSKILMQQGYVEYLGKRYADAENYYFRASALMQKNNNCDLPIVYGKQIQLYFVKEDFEKVNNYYKKGVLKAKECHIIKYEVYLAEVMMNVYKDRKDFGNAFKFTKKFDSLNKILKPSENLQELHIDREIKLKENEQKQRDYRWLTILSYTVVLLIMSIIIFLIRRYALKLKTKNNEHLHTIEEMKQLVKDYEFKDQTTNSQKSLLNSRQLLIIDMIKDGKSNKEVASHLCVSENTIKYHIKIIYDILNIKKRSQLKNDIRVLQKTNYDNQ